MKFLPNHKAWIVRESASGYSGNIEERKSEPVREGCAVIKTHFSALNYKDALSASGHKGVTAQYPHIPGIDVSGEVVYSTSVELTSGQPVAVTGYDLGMNTFGGWSEFVQVPNAWVVPLPDNLSTFEAAALGTAGLTAGLCLKRLLVEGFRPQNAPIVITGASGGVGSISVALMHQQNCKVSAVTGKETAIDYLSQLGADEILMRSTVSEVPDRPLLKSRWTGAIDTVGGDLLSIIIRQISSRGAVAMCGLAGSDQLSTSVYPFILRGVSLLGIDSAEQSLQTKKELWNLFAGEWRIRRLKEIARIHQPNQIDADVRAMLNGLSTGRIVYDWRSSDV